MGSGPRKEPEDVPWVLQDAPRCTGFEQTHPPVLFEGLCCSWGAQRGAGASSPTAPRAPGQLRGWRSVALGGGGGGGRAEAALKAEASPASQLLRAVGRASELEEERRDGLVQGLLPPAAPRPRG